MKSYTDFIVDIGILRNNIKNIRSLIGDRTKFCAVVKGNAYSHGANCICNCIAPYVDFFAVASIKEAMNIRVFDKKTKILILGIVEQDALHWCKENNVSISVSSFAQLIDYGKDIGGVNIHLQVNTGLNRFGFRSVVEFKKALDYIDKRGYILEGVYSHFATKKEDKNFIKRQNYRFKNFISLVKKSNVIFHISNSFATEYDEKYRYDMVRNGFLMYGYMDNNIGNKPILTIRSRIVNILKVRKGDTVGYDRTYKVTKPMVIGIVPVGYADGLDRRLSNNFSVLIKGRKCKIVGLICMDVFMVDLTDVNAKIGDTVTLLGSDGEKSITLQDYSEALELSPYAVLLGFDYRRMNYIVKNK